MLNINIELEYMEVENLDLLNIIEVNRIRELLEHDPNLLSMFELLVLMGNTRLNEDKQLHKKILNTDDDSDEEIYIELDSDTDEEDDSMGDCADSSCRGECPTGLSH